MFGGAGLWVLVRLFGDLRHGKASLDWPRVPGRIVQSEVYLPAYERQREDDITTTSHKLRFEYEYQVQGDTYRSRKVSFVIRPQTPSRMDAIVARYPVGTDVTIRHAPDRPKLAVLEPGDEGGSKIIFLLALGCCLVFVGIGVAGVGNGVMGLLGD